MQQLSPKISPRDEILIKNLQTLISKNNINEMELSRRTGVPQPTIHKIMSGKTSNPRIYTLQSIADYFGITIDDLYSVNILKSRKEKYIGKSIPIISWSDCLKPGNPIEGLTANNWENWIVIDNSDTSYTYALHSKISMEPRFPRSTVLIVEPNLKPLDGDLVIVHYPNTQEATMRELSIDGPNQLLISLNQNVEPDKLTSPIKIIGTVIQSRFSY